MIKSELPLAFAERIERDFGPESEAFFSALDEEPPVSIRYNPYKNQLFDRTSAVPWSRYGCYLPQRPMFTLDPLLHAGTYYVQEASSMFLEEVVRQLVNLDKPLKVLDLCASPGGKSTHLASLISTDSLLVSNEVIRPRAKVLAENLAKWGVPNVVVTNNDPVDFQQANAFFDLMVVDAPCSGEGLFRKGRGATDEWSEENVNLCAARQRRIVADAWDALSEGGILVFSTCTYNSREDEENVAWIAETLGAEPLHIDLSKYPEVVAAKDDLGCHFYPYKTKGEGFFIAALRKTAESSVWHARKSKKPALAKASSAVIADVASWIRDEKDFNFLMFHDSVLVFPNLWSAELNFLIDHFSIVQCGVEVCEVKAKNMIPSHALSVSTILDQSAFEKEELDLQTALTFLKKEEIRPTATAQYILATYNGTPLGFLKRAGNRYNNLFPKEWRIRMETTAYLK